MLRNQVPNFSTIRENLDPGEPLGGNVFSPITSREEFRGCFEWYIWFNPVLETVSRREPPKGFKVPPRREG